MGDGLSKKKHSLSPGRETTLEGIAVISLTYALNTFINGEVTVGAALAALGLSIIYLKYRLRIKE